MNHPNSSLSKLAAVAFHPHVRGLRQHEPIIAGERAEIRADCIAPRGTIRCVHGAARSGRNGRDGLVPRRAFDGRRRIFRLTRNRHRRFHVRIHG